MMNNQNIPKDLGEEIIQSIFGRKIILRDKGKQFRGYVTNCSYDDGRIIVKLDSYDKRFMLDMNSYIKILQ